MIKPEQFAQVLDEIRADAERPPEAVDVGPLHVRRVDGGRNLQVPDYVQGVARQHWCDAFNYLHKQRDQRPRIVVLCGSSRFHDAFVRANYEETLAGRIVLSVGFAPGAEHGESVGITPEQKVALDELYFRKIELADEVLVLNVGGYVGESTAREIAYAHSLGLRIRYLEPVSL